MRNGFLCLTALLLGAALAFSQESNSKDRLVEELRTGITDKNYKQAQVVLDELLRLEPENYQLHNLRGVCYEKAGRYPEATPSYRKALELEPTALTARLNLALNYLRLEKYTDAAREFATLVEREGSAAIPAPNPYQQAPVGPELERFARLLPPEEARYFPLGRLFLRHRLPEAAGVVFFVGTQVLPRSALLHDALGWASDELGRFDEAQNWFRKALQLEPDYYDACLRLGHSYFSAGQLDKTIETYRSCVSTQPGHYAGHYFLGLFLLRANPPQIDEAISHLEEAVKRNPFSTDSHYHLGRAYAAKETYSQARREFEIVVRENPENEDGEYRLGMVYKELKQEQQAQQHLKRFEALRAERERRMSDQLPTGPLDRTEAAAGKTAEAVAAFCSAYRDALAKGRYEEIWGMLTERSKALYHDDPQRFRETLTHVDPGLMDRMKRSMVGGGKLVAGRIICEFRPVDGISLPPLVLVRDGDRLRIDYAFDLSLAGLAHLGGRAGPGT